jgi:hypothetical protein
LGDDCWNWAELPKGRTQKEEGKAKRVQVYLWVQVISTVRVLVVGTKRNWREARYYKVWEEKGKKKKPKIRLGLGTCKVLRT